MSAPEPVLHIRWTGSDWELVLPGSGQHVRTETLADARRVAYLCGAHGDSCALVVHDGRDGVHREDLGGHPDTKMPQASRAAGA